MNNQLFHYNLAHSMFTESFVTRFKSLAAGFVSFLFVSNMLPAMAASAAGTGSGMSAAADTLRLTLQEAETFFLDQNLQLVAEHLNLDIKEARIRQARLWPNPEIYVEHQVVNRQGKAPVGFTGNDNTVFGIEQLLSTAGKRRRTVHLLRLEKQEAEHRFDLILRELRRTLREEFFELAYLNRKARLYHQQIESLRQVVSGFEELQKRGEVARIETLRLRSLLIGLEDELSNTINEQYRSEHSLRVLLRLPGAIPAPVLPDEPALHITPTHHTMELQSLLRIARESRSDLKKRYTSYNAAQQLLRVEQSKAYPNVRIGLVYDRLDGIVEHYWGLNLGFQIPLFNRNQGAAQAARHLIKQKQHDVSQLHLEVETDVERALKRYNRALQLYRQVEAGYGHDFSELIKSLLRQYREGQIRLVEFIDYYDSFRESMVRIWNIQEELLQSAEDLNFATGQDVIQLNF